MKPLLERWGPFMHPSFLSCMFFLVQQRVCNATRAEVGIYFTPPSLSFSSLPSVLLLKTSRTVPHLIHILSIYGFKYTICVKPTMWYGSGAVGLWTQLFILSKVSCWLHMFVQQAVSCIRSTLCRRSGGDVVSGLDVGQRGSQRMGK